MNEIMPFECELPKMETANDNVNHPKHYEPLFKSRELECIDFTRHMSFSQGNAFKYIWRAGEKGGTEKLVEDLDKAAWYLYDFSEYEVEEPRKALLKALWCLLKVPEEGEALTRYCILEDILMGDAYGAVEKICEWRGKATREKK